MRIDADNPRLFVDVYNEATGFCVIAGEPRPLDYDAVPTMAASGQGLFQSLMQDDEFGIRLVLGERSEEEQQVVASVTGRLCLPDGVLFLSGGFPTELDEEYVHRVAVPPGDYRVDLHTCASSVNAMHLDGWDELMEALGDDRDGLVDFILQLRPWDGVALTETDDGWLDEEAGQQATQLPELIWRAQPRKARPVAPPIYTSLF